MDERARERQRRLAADGDGDPEARRRHGEHLCAMGHCACAVKLAEREENERRFGPRAPISCMDPLDPEALRMPSGRATDVEMMHRMRLLNSVAADAAWSFGARPLATEGEAMRVARHLADWLARRGHVLIWWRDERHRLRFEALPMGARLALVEGVRAEEERRREEVAFPNLSSLTRAPGLQDVIVAEIEEERSDG